MNTLDEILDFHSRSDHEDNAYGDVTYLGLRIIKSEHDTRIAELTAEVAKYKAALEQILEGNTAGYRTQAIARNALREPQS